MSDADRAFARAEERIAEAIAEGATKLYLSGGDFAALTHIPESVAGISDLQVLGLEGTRIDDLSPLAECSRMWRLELASTPVADLSPLSGIKGLRMLDLSNTQVADIWPLAEMSGMWRLDLSSTQLADLTPLTGIPGLQRLFLSNTEVIDLAPLAGATGLKVLHLHNTGTKDLAPLTGITGLERLFLRNTQVADLTPLSGLAALQRLYLDKTRVTDLAPLSGLDALTGLDLYDTNVADLAPLAHLKGLQTLSFNRTQVADLRPLSGLSNLLQPGKDGFLNGLWFETCPATARDPELKRLSEIEDHQERTEQTLAYLQSLPPWPEPLPWLPSLGDRETPLSDPPQVEGLPEVRVTAEGVDVVPGIATAEDLADPIKSQLYAQLGPALDKLLRQGNRYPEVAGPAQAMRDLAAVPFADADILGLHVHLLAMEDVRTEDAARPAAERMDADCRLALSNVLRVAPPITMGHPHVAEMEARNAEFRDARVSEAQAESERRLAASVGRARDHATEPARALGATLGRSATEGRLAQPRRTFVMGVVMGAGGLVVGGALAQVGAEGTGWAFKWLAAHKDEIWTAAQGWGDVAFKWVKDMLAQVFAPRRL